MKKHQLLLILIVLIFFVPICYSQLIINEVYADVAVSLIGDANGDEIRHAREDEFIEIFNNGEDEIDISGFEIIIRNTLKHQFEQGVKLPSKTFLVLFGGGQPRGLFGNSAVFLASSGSLGLSNNGTTIRLQDVDGWIVDSMSYAAININASLVRTPEFVGDFIAHTERPDAFGKSFSPGTLTNSFPFNDGLKTLIQFNATLGAAIERDAGIDLFLNLINPRPANVLATVELTGGTGTSEDLDGFTNEIINFPVNANSQRRLTIPIAQDKIVEGRETFIFTITMINDPDNNQISINQTYQLTLFDDDTDFGLVLTEFLADPANDESGDANKDGERSSSQDEFVEFLNITDFPLDLSGMTIYDGTALRHQIPDGTIVQPKQLFLVFGGGDISADFGESLVQKASTTRLSLANTGDRIIIRDSLNDIMLFHEYGIEGGTDQAIVFCPNLGDEDGPNTLHTTIDDNESFSPGKLSACQLSNSTSLTEEYITEIVVYPNPMTSQFFLDLPTKLKLEKAFIITITGQKIAEFNKTGWITLPETIAKGCYFLEIKTNKGTIGQKIIIE